MNLERAAALADAVLVEGYALYPYRASAPKNRYRWTFGVVAPRAWSDAGGCEPWWLETQLLIAGAAQQIAGRLRFLQVERRPGPTGWEEGRLRTVDFAIGDGLARVQFGFGALVGRLVLERQPVAAERPLTKVAIRIENHTPWSDPEAPRAEAMRAAFASTHVLVGVTGGTALSAIAPPDWARAAAATCKSARLYPVLVGRTDDLVLAAPFILPDHPEVAPESVGDSCDATEIDELLILRTRTLTDDEKREARATDPRTAAIVDRAEQLSPEAFARMHGAARDLRAGEMAAQRRPAIGAKVRLLAPHTRTDAQDLLYAGQLATVVVLREDVDGATFAGVTIDADPAAELHRWYGRFHFYRLDEIEVL